MSDSNGAADPNPQAEPDSPAHRYDGPERRRVDVADRRNARRGGRRLTDTLVRIADFVYDLLTEPPQ